MNEITDVLNVNDELAHTICILNSAQAALFTAKNAVEALDYMLAKVQHDDDVLSDALNDEIGAMLGFLNIAQGDLFAALGVTGFVRSELADAQERSRR